MVDSASCHHLNPATIFIPEKMEPAFVGPVSFDGSLESSQVGEVLSSESGGGRPIAFCESGEAYFVGFPSLLGGEGTEW